MAANKFDIYFLNFLDIVFPIDLRYGTSPRLGTLINHAPLPMMGNADRPAGTFARIDKLRVFSVAACVFLLLFFFSSCSV